MLSRRGICWPSLSELGEIDRQRKIVAETANILKCSPQPDTFIGRKTQEPFP
jgi:hypothetical protein